MAGVVPKRSTSGRKQWTLHDGPRSSLKRLRNQLASDGCPESQVVLAKQLLDEQCGEVDADFRENARLGVYWLMKASEQGNLEATDLLKTCLQTGKGITELNYLDVKSCISMTQDEKLAKKAAREMFASLSNGGEYITSDQLQRKMLAIERDHSTSKWDQNGGQEIHSHENGDMNGELVCDEIESDEDTDWSQRSENSQNNEKLTEDHLVSAASDYSHGHLPLVSRILCLSRPDLKALDHIPLIQQPILHPILAMKILYYKLIRFLGRQFHFLLPLAKSEFQLLVLMLAYILVSTDNLLFFLPMLLYYLTFVLMVLSTCQMLQVKREFHEFRLWSGLFICYSGGGLNAEQAEFQYVRNNLKPFGVFFVSLLVNLTVYPIIVEQWIPQSELTIVSFCLTFMTLLGFMPTRRSKTIFDYLVFLSFGINVLAKYPYDTDPVVAQGWRFLDLKIPTFASYVIGNGIEFCINFRIFLYLGIPVLFVKIASRENWRGTYKTLIPHCVTLSWLQMCIISSQGATMYGLLRGSLALVGIVLFLPLVGLTSVVLPAAALTKWVVTSDIFLGICAFLGICLVALGLYWLCAKSRYKKLTAAFQIVSMFAAVLVLSKSMDYQPITGHYYNDGERNLPPQFISWEVYQRFCHQPVWQEENIALAQMKCSELEGARIHWDGYINDIKIKSVTNRWRALFDRLPNNLRQYFYCMYGDDVSDDCDNFPSTVKDECHSFHNVVKSISQCSLRKYNVYTFDITVKMHSGIWGKSPQVNILVDDYFKNFTLGLKPNDHVWFKAVLYNGQGTISDDVLGGLNTHVRLEEIGCLACSNSKLSSIKKDTENRVDFRSVLNALVLGLKFVLNVLLNPIVVFK